MRHAIRIPGLLLACAVCAPLAVASRLLALTGARGISMRLAARVQQLWSRAFLAVLRVELDVHGAPRRGPCLVVANHLSYVDIAVLSALFPGRFVAKSEIAGWPLLGWVTRSLGTIFVRQQSRRDLVRVEREMAHTLAAGVPVVLFPEGHATGGSGIDRLHSSLLECAVRSGAPCVAVSLGYETPEDRWAPAATVCWWGGMGFWRHAWGLIGLRRVVARVHVAAEARLEADRKTLGRALHADLVRGFVPVRQAPIAPDCPWARLFTQLESTPGGAPRRSRLA